MALEDEVGELRVQELPPADGGVGGGGEDVVLVQSDVSDVALVACEKGKQ